MAHELLTRAADAVDAAGAATTDTAASDRLRTLADQLRAQAERDTTPALGALDRVLVKLREIEGLTDEPTTGEAIERARQDVLAFLGTLDDRGMKQHGGGRNADADGSA